MTARRLAALIITSGLLAALILGLLPNYFTTVEGYAKDVYVEKQRVGCGIGIWPRYEPPPLGVDDECDHVTIARWMLMLAVIGSAGLLATGALLAPKVRRRFSLH